MFIGNRYSVLLLFHVRSFACSVRKLSQMTENLSKTVLNGVEMVTGSVVVPVVRTKAGKTVLALAPAQAVLASFAALGTYSHLNYLFLFPPFLFIFFPFNSLWPFIGEVSDSIILS